MKKTIIWTLLSFLLLSISSTLEAAGSKTTQKVLLKKTRYGKKDKAKTPKISIRDYNAPISEANKKDLRDIVTTLAQASLTSLSGHKSRLKEAGDRIDFFHPFKFLYLILSDPELRGNFRTIRDRSWVWREFRDNLTNTLIEESKVDNLKREHLHELASTLNISVDSLYAPIQDKKWNDFVEVAVKALPKIINDRTDM